MKHIKTLTLAVSVAMLSACSTLPNANTSGAVYSEGQALAQATVAKGVITSMQPAQIEQDNTLAKMVGGGLGMVLGGAAGSNVGGGSGEKIATLVGAVLGGAAGAAITEHVAGRVDGHIYTVRMAYGGELQVVQANDAKSPFSVGETVSVSRMTMADASSSRSRSRNVKNVYRITKSAQ